MEKIEISIHEARIYTALRTEKGKWLTNQEVEKLLPDVAGSTIRHATSRLFQMGILERVAVFPRYRYRWSERREQRDHAYEVRLETACNAFGLS